MAYKADIDYNHVLLNLLTYFMPQNVINLGECSYEFEKKKTFCCSWLKKSVDSNYNQLIDSVAEVRHVLPGFLRLLGAIISDRGVLESLHVKVSSIYFCSSISFCLTYFDASLLGI